MIERVPELFGEPVPPYFLMLMVGFAAATFVAARWAKRSGLDKEVMIDLGLYSLIAGVAGARLMHVIADGYFWDYVHLCTDPGKVIWRITEAQCSDAMGVWVAARGICQPAERDCLAWAAFWRGGLTYYGGLIAAVGYGLWLLRREGFPMWKGADAAGVSIAIGLFFGRIGCFLGGCCFGKVTSHWLGCSFPPWSAASEQQHRDGLLAGEHMSSLPVHPTQLYEAAGTLAIATLLMLWVHPRKRFDGQVLCAFLIFYAALRFSIEYLRADDRGGMLGLSTSQLLSLAAVSAAGVLWQRREQSARRSVVRA